MFGPPISRLAIFSALAAVAGLSATVGGLLLIEIEQWHGGTGALLMIGALVGAIAGMASGIASVRAIKRSEGLLAGEGLATGGLSLAAVGLVAFLVSTQFGSWADKKADESRDLCTQNLKVLRQAMATYAERNEGSLPPAKNWCGAILGMAQELQQSPDFRGSLFQCPSSLTTFQSSYGFNANLEGLKLADIPLDAILLFEIDGGWNVSGGEESVVRNPRHNSPVFCLADGRIVGPDLIVSEKQWTARP
ncbi:MAG: hypothetical protein ACI9VS_001635 [Candidatus Binatia bacterium]|jgi:hypothetical protein